MNIKRRIRCFEGLHRIPLVLLTIAIVHVPAAHAFERPITLQIGGGVRLFNDQLGLKNGACAGVRMDLGLSDRFSLGLDYVFSSPARSTTNAIAQISALRALARMNLLGGATKPYVVMGAGGVLMNFSDAIDASTGTLTAGAGISHDLGAHQVISIEGSADIYASRRQYFDVYGRPVYDSGNIYQPLGTISANLGFRF